MPTGDFRVNCIHAGVGNICEVPRQPINSTFHCPLAMTPSYHCLDHKRREHSAKGDGTIDCTYIGVGGVCNGPPKRAGIINCPLVYYPSDTCLDQKCKSSIPADESVSITDKLTKLLAITQSLIEVNNEALPKFVDVISDEFLKLSVQINKLEERIAVLEKKEEERKSKQAENTRMANSPIDLVTTHMKHAVNKIAKDVPEK